MASQEEVQKCRHRSKDRAGMGSTRRIPQLTVEFLAHLVGTHIVGLPGGDTLEKAHSSSVYLG